MAADDFRWELLRPRLQLPCVPYHGLPQHTVDRFPDKIATVFGSQQLSFREIDGLSGSLARSLRDLDVTKGDRVALFMTNRLRSAAELTPSRLDLGGGQLSYPPGSA